MKSRRPPSVKPRVPRHLRYPIDQPRAVQVNTLLVAFYRRGNDLLSGPTPARCRKCQKLRAQAVVDSGRWNAPHDLFADEVSMVT
jgi:hypothetical protein